MSDQLKPRFTDINDYVAELEKDPEMKAELDEARIWVRKTFYGEELTNTPNVKYNVTLNGNSMTDAEVAEAVSHILKAYHNGETTPFEDY